VLLRGHIHRSIAAQYKETMAQPEKCPACYGMQQRVNRYGVWQVCECTSYPASMAEEFGLPEYPAPEYDTGEEVDSDEDQ